MFSRGPLQRIELFPEKEGRHASFALGNLAHSSVTAAMQSSAVTGPWTAKCYICSILILFKESKGVYKMLSRWLFGKVCVWWSQYQGRAAVQTPATDLMDEVSHTHLRCEHKHLHQTHMGQHNEPHSYNNVFLVTSFCSSTVFYYGTFTSVFDMCSCLFIRSTLNRPLESSTCFSKRSKSSTITYAVVSVKKSFMCCRVKT